MCCSHAVQCLEIAACEFLKTPVAVFGQFVLLGKLWTRPGAPAETKYAR